MLRKPVHGITNRYENARPRCSRNPFQEEPMRKLLSAISGAAMALVAGTAVAADVSPIFGHADVKATTAAENKGIVGKGEYGELYGYYGTYYASYATQYG